MKKINTLLLLSKNDIPFTEAQVNIHQPTIREISLIGEESFRFGCQILTFSKDLLPYEDKINLGDKTDFDIFMSAIGDKKEPLLKNTAFLLLTLLFPNYNISFHKDRIELLRTDDFHRAIIDSENFPAFREILTEMFVLKHAGSKEEYNPADKVAARIAAKLNKRKEILAQKSGASLENIEIFSQYVSILAIGEQKDMNALMEYTVFQLEDEFTRFRKKQDFDYYVQAKMAGAENLEEVDNWMDNIHP